MIRFRLIPAGAGNTCGLRYHPMDRRAHPRWRGEHGAGEDVRGVADGSSPLAREIGRAHV